MDYLKLIRSFWKKHKREKFSGTETLLYLQLVELFNAEGEGKDWPDELRIGDGELCNETGLSPNSIKGDKGARLRLIERGMISFEPVGKGFRGGGSYQLLYIESSSKRTSRSSSEFDELPATSSNSDELNAKDSQQVRQEDGQKASQEDGQNLTNSPIYIGIQTPNNQTSNSNDDDARRQEKPKELETKEKEGNPTPPSPPPPIPIPKGKTYGDGKLQADVLAYYAQYPDQFPLSIYLPFLRHYTQIFQKGRPDLIGTEKWRGLDFFELEDKLARWHQNDLTHAEKPKVNGTQSVAASGNSESGNGSAEIIRKTYTKQSFGQRRVPV